MHFEYGLHLVMVLLGLLRPMRGPNQVDKIDLTGRAHVKQDDPIEIPLVQLLARRLQFDIAVIGFEVQSHDHLHGYQILSREEIVLIGKLLLLPFLYPQFDLLDVYILLTRRIKVLEINPAKVVIARAVGFPFLLTHIVRYYVYERVL